MCRRAICCAMAAALLCLASCSTVYMKGTPLYTGDYSKPQGPPEDRVNVWPIAYYHKPALSVLWPLMDFTDDHAAIRPVFTVYKLDKPHHEWNLFWPLVQFDFDADQHRIVPLFWGRDEDKKPYFVAFPEVWWFDKTKGVFPVFWWKDGFTVFPLGWYQKDQHSALFPLWVHTREGKGEHDTHVLWPIFRLLDTAAEKGWRVWPLVGDYKEKDSRYSYALWPLCHYSRDGDEITRVAFPFYFEDGDKKKAWWLLLPLAFRSKDGQDSLLLTPLWSEGKAGGKSWNALLPFYYYGAEPSTSLGPGPAAKTSRLLTPLAGRLESPERTQWVVVPLASSLAWGKGEKDLWLLWPIAHARWGGDNLQHHLLPLYYYDRDEKLFLSPLVSWSADGDMQHLYFLGPLAHLGWGKGELQHHVLPLYAYDRDERMFLTPLASWQSKPDDGFVNLGMLLGHYSWAKDGERRLGVLIPFTGFWWNQKAGGRGAYVFPLFYWQRWRRAKGSESDYLLTVPWMYSERSAGVRPAAKDGSTPQTAWTQRKSGLFPLWWYDRRTEAPAGGTPTRRVGFSLLGWLYDYQGGFGQKDDKDPKKTHDYVRSRILWRVMHYEKLDGGESLDLFPFITWDRKADGYRGASFLWRFYRNERTADGGRNVDLFFLPLLRRKGGSAS